MEPQQEWSSEVPVSGWNLSAWAPCHFQFQLSYEAPERLPRQGRTRGQFPSSVFDQFGPELERVRVNRPIAQSVRASNGRDQIALDGAMQLHV